MNNMIFIQWNGGKTSMTIYLDEFFPSTKPRINKPLKIISLDVEHKTEIIETIKRYITDKIPECEHDFKSYGKEHLYYKQLESDTLQIVSTQKLPNGVPISAEKLKYYKEKLNKYHSEARTMLTIAKRNKRDKERLQDNMKYISTLKSGEGK